MKRKAFIQKVGALSTVIAGVPFLSSQGKSTLFDLETKERITRRHAANDHIHLALVGAGGKGQSNTRVALNQSGVKLVAACDLYDSRLVRCQEQWGSEVTITRDYREILTRDDIDAVIIASSDHWHARQAIDFLNAGKAVYLEKPMIHRVEEGSQLIEAEKASGKPLLVGSQRTSSIMYEKVRELFRNGEIGELNFVESNWDRNSARGAWQYNIPPSASTENIAWDTYIEGLSPRPFDPKHFFRWRNYKDYGTGATGDLFVHLFSGLHMLTDSKGPETIMATGGLRFWKDGRDVPDVMLGIYDYPESDTHPPFNLVLRINFVDGSGGGHSTRLVGNEGEIVISSNTVTLRKSPVIVQPSLVVRDFSEEVRKEYEAYYRKKYPEQRPSVIEPSEFIYRAPTGYNDSDDHFANFFEAIRNNKPVLQDGEFGLRAAAPAILSNISHDEKRVVSWDPVRMKQIKV